MVITVATSVLLVVVVVTAMVIGRLLIIMVLGILLPLTMPIRIRVAQLMNATMMRCNAIRGRRQGHGVGDEHGP